MALNELYTREEVNSFTEGFDKNVSEFDSQDLITENVYDVLKNSVDRGFGAVELKEYLIKKIQGTALSFIPEGFPVPEFSTTVYPHETEPGNSDSYTIVLKVKSTKNSDVSNIDVTFRRTVTHENGEAVVADYLKFFTRIYRSLVLTSMGAHNIGVVSSVFDDIATSEEVNLPFRIDFISETESIRNFIEDISDEGVTFVIPDDVVFDKIPSIPLFQGIADNLPAREDVDPKDLRELYLLEDNNKTVQSQSDAIAQDLAKISTPVELLKLRIEAIKVLTNVGTRKPSTLIEKAFSKKIQGAPTNGRKNFTAVVKTDEIIGAVKWVAAHTETDADGNKVDVAGEWFQYLAPVTLDSFEPSQVDIVEVAKGLLR